MLREIGLACLLMLATTSVHTAGMFVAMRLTRWHQQNPGRFMKVMHSLRVGGVIILMFLVAIVEVLLWALTYLWIDALDNFYDAIYFSMVTFTTLGYGDIVPKGQWRLLASSQAACGIIMFGWTTAIVISVVQRIYIKDKDDSA